MINLVRVIKGYLHNWQVMSERRRKVEFFRVKSVICICFLFWLMVVTIVFQYTP